MILKMMKELPRIYLVSSQMIPKPIRTASKMPQYNVDACNRSEWLEPIYFSRSAGIALSRLIKKQNYIISMRSCPKCKDTIIISILRNFIISLVYSTT